MHGFTCTKESDLDPFLLQKHCINKITSETLSRERVFTVGILFSWKALMILCQGRMRGDLSLFCFIFFFFSFSIFQRVACCCCFAPLTVKYRHLVGTLTNLWRPQWKDSTTTTTRKVEPLVLSKETFSLSLSIDYRLSLVVFEMPLTPKRCWVCVCVYGRV